MSKHQPEAVGLRRGPERRRRFPWWILAVIIPLLLIAGGFAWVNQLKIQRWIADLTSGEPTAAPPPPGEGAGEGAVLYETNFDSPSAAADWEAAFDDGTISALISNGQLVVDVDALTDVGTWLAMNFTFSDFVLDVDATKLGGPDDNGIIVLFRLQDNENYNRFDISSDGYYTVSMARGGERIVISDFIQSDAIITGAATNHVRVYAVGDTFRFEVNGTPLTLCVSDGSSAHPIPMLDEAGALTCMGGQLTDSWQNGDLMEGKIGLGAQGFVGFDGENSRPALATIGFDNLVITAPDSAGQ